MVAIRKNRKRKGEITLASRIQLRRDTAQNFAEQNTLLAQGEVAWELNSSKFKIGDGVHRWNELDYIQFGEIPNNGTLTIQKNGTTIATFTANQAGDTTANIVADTPAWGNITGTLANQTDLSQALATKLTASDIYNVLNSTAIDKALSANMGKELNDRLNNVESRGRFLSVWDCTTGLPETDPVGLETGDVYEYQRGDYYIVGGVGTTNYRPAGTSYVVGTASTVVETETVKENDTYIFDGSVWILQQNTDRDVTFATVAGSPYDNSNLASALNSKQDEITQNAKLSADLVDDTSTTNKFVSATDITNWNGKVDANTAITGGTKCKITYDEKGLVTAGADLASTDVTNALGYTPYNNSNPSGYQANVLEGVQINGTDLTIDVNKKVNIPVASTNTNGVVRVNTSKGITASSGQLETVAADSAEITAKTSTFKPIVPSTLNVAIREGLGNNSLTWTDAYKTSARNTIGATRVSFVDWID